MALLGVNVDHIATIRQARLGIDPDPVHAASIAEMNGADQITIHLREDRRHIQERDLAIMRQTVQTKLNLEMAATKEMVAMAIKYKPDTVTLVPEKREELTTEGGLFLIDAHKAIVDELKAAGIEVSVFIEADPKVINKAAELGADAVELHTGHYANLKDKAELDIEIERLKNGAELIDQLGMRVVAGHGLNYHNITALVELGLFEEFNIGHSIVSRAFFSGMAEAVMSMKNLVAY